MASSTAGYAGGGGGGSGGSGGIGGKFRKRPFRHSTAPATPYDRPASALRGAAALRGAREEEGGGGWISRLVDPASRIISTGAARLFSSVFRKRFHPALLPPPPLPTPPAETATVPIKDTNLQSDEQVIVATDNNSSIAMDEKNGLDIHKQINKLEVKEMSDLEQLLQNKTFTRVEFDRLTELLRSRIIESDGSQPVFNNDDVVNVTLAQNEIVSSKILGGISIAGRSSMLPAAEIASPAEIAKAYMGSRPSKVSPSSLSLQRQDHKNDMATCTNLQYATKASDASVVQKPIVRFSGAVEPPENGYLTPKARGRSAIYRMSRSPFFKSGKPAWDNHACMSASSQGTPKSLKTDGKQVLKRPSSVLDNDIGSFGPIRRIRQKSNFVSPSIGRHSSFHRDQSPSTSSFMSKDLSPASASSYKKALPFERLEHGGGGIQDSGDGDGLSCAVTPIPPQSGEMARKILEQLDRLVPSPKEKSSEPKAISNHDSSSKSDPNKKDEVKDERAKGAVLGVVEASIKNKAVNSIIPSSSTLKKVDSLMSDSVGRPSRKLSFQMTSEDTMEMDDENRSKDGGSQANQPNNAVLDDLQFNVIQTLPASEDAVKASDAPVHAEKPVVFAFPAAPVSSFSQTTSAPTMPSPSFDSSAQQKDQASAPFFEFGLKDGPAFNFSSGIAGVSDSDGHKIGTSESQISFLPESLESVHKDSIENVTSVDNAALSSVSTSSASPVFSFGSPTARTLSNGSSGSPSLTNSSVMTAFPSSDIGVTTSSLVTSSSSALATASQLGSSSANASQPPVSSNFTKKDTKILEEMSIKASPFSFGTSNGTGTSIFSSSAISVSSTTTAVSTTSSVAMATSSVFASSGSGSSSLPAASPSTMSFLAGDKSSAQPELFSFSSTGGASSGLAKPSLFQNIGESSAPILLYSSSSSGSTIAASTSSTSPSSSPATFSTAGYNSFSSASTQSFGTETSAVLSSTAGLMSGTTDALSGLGMGQVGSTALTFGFSGSSASSSSSGFGSSTFGIATSAMPSNPVFGFSAGAGSSSRSSFAPATTTSLFGATSQPSMTSNWFTTSQPTFSTSQPSTSPFFGSTTTSVSTVPSVFGSTITTVSTVPSVFGSTYGATTASTPFSFGSSAPAASSSLTFSFTSSASTSSLSPAAPVFGMSTPTTGFRSISSRNDQMNMEDSMTDDNSNHQATFPPFPTFGQPSSSQTTHSSVFGAPTQPAFQFGGNQASTPQNAPSFQGAGNLEFPPGGGFSLGSGGGDKSGRRIVKVRRDRHRKR